MKFLLVGTGFIPGANAIISKGLRQRATVTLQGEPENPYDPLAVRVSVDQGEVVPNAELDEALAGFGLALSGLSWPFPLGHLGAKAETKAAKRASAAGHHFELCAEWHKLPEWLRVNGHLVLQSDGTIIIEV